MSEALQIVLSPAQLAAVLSGQSLTDGEIRSNRIWGSVKAVAGVFELIGGGLLLAAPEPTGATKVGGAALIRYSTASPITSSPRTPSPDMENDIFRAFPYLAQFMGAYFYQSALEFADSETAIIEDFLGTAGSAWYVAGLWSDIHRMMALHADTLLASFNELIKPDYIIGNDDAEARQWLTSLADRCAGKMRQDLGG